MSRTARIIVLVTALTSLFASVSSTANAVTWTNTGATSIHATGGAGTLSIGTITGNNVACSASTATATVPTHSAASTLVVPGTVNFTPCTLAGQQVFIHCGFTLTGTNFVEPSLTTGVADVTCDLRLHSSPSVKLCHIDGTTPGTYTNPTAATNTPGKVTLLTSGTGLTVTNNGATNCPWGTGTGHISEQTITVTTVAGSPIITRHP